MDLLVIPQKSADFPLLSGSGTKAHGSALNAPGGCIRLSDIFFSRSYREMSLCAPCGPRCGAWCVGRLVLEEECSVFASQRARAVPQIEYTALQRGGCDVGHCAWRLQWVPFLYVTRNPLPTLCHSKVNPG